MIVDDNIPDTYEGARRSQLRDKLPEWWDTRAPLSGGELRFPRNSGSSPVKGLLSPTHPIWS